jgi:hypothetical protein
LLAGGCPVGHDGQRDGSGHAGGQHDRRDAREPAPSPAAPGFLEQDLDRARIGGLDGLG